jgi:death-on-curing protein
LLSALGRPYATFGGEFLYKDVFEQAAAIGESTIMNHPFVDGNKRTGFALMMRVLDEAGIWIHAPSSEVYDFVIALATGDKRFEEAVGWLRSHSASR